jgi:RNA polymerase sigma factor (sigma-70 family)
MSMEEHLGLVHWVVNRMSHLLSGKVERGDLVNDGVIGLGHALENFDPSRGSRFSYYAKKCIWGQILLGQRRLYREHWIARYHGIDSNTGSIHHIKNHRYLGDSGQAARQIEGALDTQMTWRNMRTLLTPEQQEVFDLLVQEWSQADIGRRLGITRQAVSSRYRKGLHRIQTHYGRDNELRSTSS